MITKAQSIIQSGIDKLAQIKNEKIIQHYRVLHDVDRDLDSEC